MENRIKEGSVFDQFTNQYSLSKTLRFELVPIGKTLDNMKKNIGYDEKIHTFLHDQEIEDAYQTLKPIFDKLHEEFITESLTGNTAKIIDFSQYLESYKNKKDLKTSEGHLRKEIGKTFDEAGENWKEEKYSKYTWKKGSNTASGTGILSTQSMLDLIKDLYSDDTEIKEIIDGTFKGFFTYFKGFNQNRENYYTIKEEKATAVATRIVHENLPKFCDNVLQFQGHTKEKKNGTKIKIDRKFEYLNAYKYLKGKEKDTQIKDAQSGKMIEAQAIAEDIFDIAYFNNCLSQNGIEGYNRIIGHYNLLINLYNQAKRLEEKDLSKKDKIFKDLPQFKILYKQIGCGEREPIFFSLTHNTTAQAKENKEKFKKPYSVEQILRQAKTAGEKYFQGKSDDGAINTVPELEEYILEKENYEGMYWSKIALNTISNKYFANWHALKELLKDKKEVASFDKKREEQIKMNDAVNLSVFFAVLDEVNDWQKEGVLFRESLTKEIENNIDEAENKKIKERREIITTAKRPSEALLKMIFADIKEHTKNFLTEAGEVLKLKKYQEKSSIEKIKTCMDYALAVNKMLKYFSVKENKTKGQPVDSTITGALDVLLRSEDAEWFRWYDALRNYLTKKPQDDTKNNKLKLNFKNSTLAEGWDINKESANSCVLLRNLNGKIFLGIMRKDKNISFQKEWCEGRGKKKTIIQNSLYKIDEGEIWEKMEYKQIAAPTGIGGFVRKCFNTAQKLGWQCPNDCLNSEGKIITKNEEARRNLKVIIDCYKDFFNKYEKDGFKYINFNFKFKNSNEYETLNDFFVDVENQAYKISFERISKNKLDELVEDGKVYLFEIKNQDANNGKKSGHKNNLHTIYWKALFENNNKPKLSGGAELFYRKALPKEKQEKIKDKQGKEIVKNFRFSKEKFLFHCPIKLNYKATGNSNPKYALYEVNNLVNERFNATHFLGIDRGEKHLAYYSLVNQNGGIMKQGTLNLPFIDKNGNLRSLKREKYFYNKQKKEWEPREVDCWDYNDLLDARASNRDMARKNWQTIGIIKELKEGYISQAIHEIVKIATDKEHPAFIVMEDLNTGFKRGRQKIEKSVYQKFELALSKKLNFMVDKTKENGELGSVTKAIQLTPPVQNYGDIENKKQLGIMLYTRANYTSQTDPVTGWRKSIYLKTGSEENIKEQIVESFDDIYFDGKDYVFTYTDKDTGKKWELYSGKNGKSLDRFYRERNEHEWVAEKQDLVKMLDGLFDDAVFDKDKDHSLLTQIVDEGKELTKINERTAWESLRFVIHLIQQIRNTGKNGNERDNDFIQSPVREKNEKNGEHFDSREWLDQNNEKETENTLSRPLSGDANGAYNIAVKGIIMNEHIKEWVKNGMEKRDLNLLVSDQEWGLYLDDRKEWKKQLPQFASWKEIKKNNKNKKRQ